jgi:hypothetical protein
MLLKAINGRRDFFDVESAGQAIANRFRLGGRQPSGQGLQKQRQDAE